MEPATVHNAAQTTGWSVRMLHYLDTAGLVSPPRSPGGYRLYGEREITDLRTLRQMLADHDLRPADLQVALRLRGEPALRDAVDDWLSSRPLGAAAVVDAPGDQSPGATAAAAQDPSSARGPAPSWLSFEQDKHSRALAVNRYPTQETA